MTLRRDELNPLDAVRALASRYPGGVESLAKRIPRRGSEHGEPLSESLLYKKLEGVRALYLDEFVEIVTLCAAANVADANQPLRALNWRLRHVAAKLPDVDDAAGSELAERVMKVFKEGGDVARVIESSLTKDGIDEHELRAIEREIEQAIAALIEVRELAKSKAAERQAAHLKVVKQ